MVVLNIVGSLAAFVVGFIVCDIVYDWNSAGWNNGFFAVELVYAVFWSLTIIGVGLAAPHGIKEHN